MNSEFEVNRSVRNYTEGTIQTGSLLRGGELAVADVHGKYQESVLRGNVYILSTSGAAPTAYTGGAAGTPLIAIHNPANSGKNLVLLTVSVANRAQASAAGTVSMGIWGGPSVLPTGTRTNPTSMLSLAASGSAAAGFVNTALTGSTALNLILSPFTYYWATAAGAVFVPGLFDVNGLIIVQPGNQIAIGATSALTSATWDVSMIWEEIPA